MRDNFNQETRDSLAKRVGYICSNPQCRMLTVGPNTEKKSSTSIGVAAHISAASSGGPRFDSKLSNLERSSIENGIWLCQSCATLIDRDQIKYNVDVLNKWKKEAELEASKRLNKQFSGGVMFSDDEDLNKVKPNGYYEKNFFDQKIRFYVDSEDHMHIEQEQANGLIAYYIIDKDGNIVNYKWPFPLNEYEIVISPDLIIKSTKEHLTNGLIKETVKMKWGKEATITKKSNGELHSFEIKKGYEISHTDKKIWINPPEFIKAGSFQENK